MTEKKTEKKTGKKTEKKTEKKSKDLAQQKSEAEWKKELSPEEYRILREKGTEVPFTGKYNEHEAKGIYTCAGCGAKLFDSEAKFDSGTGWPSFFQPLREENLDSQEDRTLGRTRTEILCSQCQGHLGHVFDDGPEPTGKRYCINSAALKFAKKTDNKKD